MPNISGARLRELERAEKELQDRIEGQSIAWVGEKLGEALAINLATKPWEDWTEGERILLRMICGGASTAFMCYKMRLPKKQ